MARQEAEICQAIIKNPSVDEFYRIISGPNRKKRLITFVHGPEDNSLCYEVFDPRRHKIGLNFKPPEELMIIPGEIIIDTYPKK